ncbi:MAG: hypothetical protein H7Y60_15110 [Rhodospirillaceae bacterium]|nr:hypothetical protein [Rhodospirillales bacterium]
MTYAIRSAHTVGPTKGAAVRLDGDLVTVDAPLAGARPLYSVRSPDSNDDNTYTITDGGPGAVQMVYWLPWGQNAFAAISVLNKSAATIFLTSEFSGCYFIGCKNMVMHTAAGYTDDPINSAWKELTEWGEDADKDTNERYVLAPYKQPVHEHVTAVYGAERGISRPVVVPRAVVMGCRYPVESTNWLFAYQDLTIDTPDYGMWKPLKPV